MGGAHWEAYRAHCTAKKILPNPAAVPDELRKEKDQKFTEDEYVFTFVILDKARSCDIFDRLSQTLITQYGQPKSIGDDPWTQEGLQQHIETFVLETDKV
jgi:hypothetical protein